MFCHLGHFFFLSWPVCYLKGQSLRCSLGRSNAGRCAVTLYVGGSERDQWRPLHSPPDLVTTFATHNQIGSPWCWFPSGWVCARSRPLWVSPATSPVRLGVSPAAAPTPTGVFNQRFEALFPRTGALGYSVCFAPAVRPGLSVLECGAEGYYPPLCLPRSPLL